MDHPMFNDKESLELDTWVGGPNIAGEDVAGMTDPFDFINNFVVDNEFCNLTAENLFMSNPETKLTNVAENFFLGNEEYLSSHSSDSGNYSPKSSSSDNQILLDPWSVPSNYTDSVQSSSDKWTPSTTLTDNSIQNNEPMYNEELNNNNQNFNYVDQEIHYASNNNQMELQPQHNIVQSPPNFQAQPSSVYFVVQENANLKMAPEKHLILPQQSQIRTILPSNTPLALDNSSRRLRPYPVVQRVQVKAEKIPILNRPANLNIINNNPAPIKQNSLTQSTSELSDFLKRKEDRKLRNRASAQLSRQRKRAEYEKLTSELDTQKRICNDLRIENENLKKRVEELEKENRLFMQNSATSRNLPPKTGNRTMAVKTAGVCMLVMFAFMTLPGSNYFPNELQTHRPMFKEYPNLSLNTFDEKKNLTLKNALIANARMGRALATIDDSYDSDLLENSTKNFTSGRMHKSLNTNDTIGCNDNNGIHFLNTSQRIKLNTDLLDWIVRHEKKHLIRLRDGNNPSLIFNSDISPAIDNFLFQKSPVKKENKNGLVKQILSQKFENNVSTNSSSNWKNLNGNKRTKHRTTQMKIEEARLKAINVRAWRDLRMLSDSKIATNSQNLAEKSRMNNDSRRPSLIRFGAPPSPLPASSFKIHEDSAKTNNDSQFSLTRLGYTQAQQMIEFINLIKHKEDMLHIVALKDYFLLPALKTHNSTSSPKISIILPALYVNATAPGQTITMMRIECEVVATSIFHLPASVTALFDSPTIPKF